MTTTPKPFGSKPFVSSYASSASKAENALAFPVDGPGRLNLMPEDSAQAADMDMARFIMALRAKGLRNTSLMAAFEKVVRRDFFPEDLRSHAYADIALPLPCGQEATSAHVIAHVLNLAALVSTSRVLEIGTGSGYQTALIASMVESVDSIERCKTLASLARKAIRQAGMTNVDLRVGNGLARQDLPSARFDCIILNGAVADLPEALIGCLADTGTIIAPMILAGGDDRRQELRRIMVGGEGFKVDAFAFSRFGALIDARSAAL